MAISDAMLSEAILEYLQKHVKEFERFLFERYDIDDGYINLQGDRANQQLFLTVTTMAQDGEKLSERTYTLKTETAKPEINNP